MKFRLKRIDPKEPKGHLVFEGDGQKVLTLMAAEIAARVAHHGDYYLAAIAETPAEKHLLRGRRELSLFDVI